MDATAEKVETPNQDQEPQERLERSPDPAEKTLAAMFRYSTWLHIGPGAHGCEAIDEGAGTNDCGDPLHFHAWLRLPNQFQQRELREKGAAAKARKVRQLRDPDSDAGAILEDELDEFRRQGEEGKKTLVYELVNRDWYQDFTEAAYDVGEDEADGVKTYEHVEQDQRRFAELQAMAESDRPDDEFNELAKHLADYHDAVQKRLDEIQKPRRESLEAQSLDEIVDQARAGRIEADANDEFMHVFNVWEWYLGALRQPRGDRRFQSMEQLQDAAPEVIEALKEAFQDLEVSLQKSREPSGNS